VSADGQDRRVLRLVGPPGTGKTTRLASRVRADVTRLGSDSTLIASFTVTAAQEIASRGLGLAPGYVGTLHRHAYAVCGHPPVALDVKVVADWNAHAPNQWSITGSSKSGGLSTTDRAGSGTRAHTPEQADTGDELVAALDLLRAQAIPPDEWPDNVRRFAKRWFAWKKDVGALDFSDMIVEAYRRARDGEGPPGNPKRFIVDEAQDLTRIELALAMLWAEHCELTVFAFDDDQAINAWRGGDPSTLVDLVDGPGANESTISTEVLAQSYRVPPAVHAVAQAWIQTCQHRLDKAYLPRAADPARGDTDDRDARGYAYRLPIDIGDPALVDQIEADLERGETPMVLASCKYMLARLVSTMRERGIPFHNPYRPADGSWNPLGGGAGMSTAERVYRYLVADRTAMGTDSRRWTGDDIRAWSDLLSKQDAGFVHGVGKRIDALPNGEVPWELVSSLWRPGPPDEHGNPTASMALARAVAPDLEWLAECIVGSKQQTTAYPLQVARQRGPHGLTDDAPRCVIGTIHSVKGATADRVYIAPDLSGAAARQWHGSDPRPRDEMIRLFYVAITRAFRDVVILTPTGNAFVDPTALLSAELEVRR
jgi:superfamily I DNA/RNA helicase